MKPIATIFAVIPIAITCQTCAQTNYNNFDPEPVRTCWLAESRFTLELQRDHDYCILPLSKGENESDQEWQRKRADCKAKNEQADKINHELDLKIAKYVDDSLKNEKCIAKWEADVLAWRKRNPNWMKTASYKGELNYSDGKSRPVSEGIDFVEKVKPEAVKGESYKVTAQVLNLRTGAGKNYPSIQSIRLGEEVTLINSDNGGWWYVDYRGFKGYLFSQFLQGDPYISWDKKNYQTGITPECENVTPQYDYNIDNYLKVNASSTNDAVIKLMKIKGDNDICIRIAYIRSGDTYSLKNIPEGRYYLKIASGKDYRQKIVDGNCVVKFITDAKYEKGSEVLDYYKIKRPNKIIGDTEYENWSVPSFDLQLNVLKTKFATDEFKSKDINEAEFNK